MSNGFQDFLDFIKSVGHRLRGMAYKLRGDLTADDLRTKAFIIAEEIRETRGTPVDYHDPKDREDLLSKLFWDAKGENDWRLKSAYSIDDDAEGSTPWSDRLVAPKSDPLEIILQRGGDGEEFQHPLRYSQLAAYKVAVKNFDFDVEAFCSHLSLSTRALTQRVVCAKEEEDRQWSVFDGVCKVDPSFAPLARYGHSRNGVILPDSPQMEIAFV